MLNEEVTQASQRVYAGRVVGLRVDTVRLPGGGTSTREIVEHGGSVSVLPVDDRGAAFLVRQYRKPVELMLLEVPAGGMEAGEEPEACARRELLEETGYKATRLQFLGRFFMSPGFCDELMYAFLAMSLTAGRARPEPDERLQVVSVALQDIPRMVWEGQIQDAKSIATLLLALHHLGILR